ncbi:hypothetical protein BC828DRAFT_386935 [Blastocladiella britannica]|nr:hypothetical protein BC828DRAFT_386935 [Blastocladiella britannica]
MYCLGLEPQSPTATSFAAWCPPPPLASSVTSTSSKNTATRTRPTRLKRSRPRPPLQDTCTSLTGRSVAGQLKPTTFFSLLDLVFIDATEHARLPVMEWCTSSGLDLTDSLRVYFDVATTYCRLESLEYLKAYALERNLPYKFGTGLSLEQEFPSGRYLAMLNWWKIEHAVQQRPPLVETDMGSLVEAA